MTSLGAIVLYRPREFPHFKPDYDVPAVVWQVLEADQVHLRILSETEYVEYNVLYSVEPKPGTWRERP